MQDCSVLQLGADISWTYSNSSFLIYKALMNCSCPLSSKNEWEWWCNFFEREASERLAAGLYILIKRLVRLIEVDPESCGQTLWTPLTVWSGRKERQRERSIIQTCCCCRAAGGDYSRKSAQVDAASTSRRISAQYAGRHRWLKGLVYTDSLKWGV